MTFPVRAGAMAWPVADDGEREGSGRLGDVFVFLVPLLLAVDFNLGGRLFLSEIVLVLALPFLLDQARRRGVSRVPLKVVGLGLIWLIGQVVTDLVRMTPEADWTRGWSKIVFLLVNLASLALLIDGRWRRIWLFGAGLAVGEAVQFYVHPSAYAIGDPWKFGLGPAVSLGGALLASWPSVYRRPLASAGILLALAVVNLQMDFRSMAGVCFLAGVGVLLAGRSDGVHVRRSSRRRAALITCISVLGGLGFVQLYQHAAQGGALGVRAQTKYDAQQSSLGILLSGRPEITVAARAIRDSPIIGHGSWAKDPKYVQMLFSELRNAGYRGTTVPLSQDLIPTHSHLFGAWVEAGIAGAIFWLWALGLVVSVLPRLHGLADERVPLLAFLGVSFLWDVLFSPFGAERRVIVPYCLLALLLAQADLRRRNRPREAG